MIEFLTSPITQWWQALLCVAIGAGLPAVGFPIGYRREARGQR